MGAMTVFVGMLLSFLAFLSDILAIALPWWTYTETHPFGEYWKSNHGLWEECKRVTDVFGETKSSCSGIEEPEGHVDLCRNLCLFGMFLIIAGMLLTCIGRWILSELRLVPVLGALAMLIAGLLIWIGVVMFSAKHVQTAGHAPTDLHAGWGLGVSSAFLSFISSIFLVWDRRKAGDGLEDETQGQSDEFMDTNRVSPLSGDTYLRKSSWDTSEVGSFRSRSSHVVPSFMSSTSRSPDTPITSISRLEAKAYKN